MLINKILEDDTRNCYEAMKNDIQLEELEKKFYELTKEDMEVERVFSAYMARVIRIAYLQGMKKFAELCGVLKQDTQEILQRNIGEK